jgi:hypothetical protein
MIVVWAKVSSINDADNRAGTFAFVTIAALLRVAVIYDGLGTEQWM